MKQSIENFKEKQAEKEKQESRHRALEQERQEMILRRTREAEAKRLAEQQAIEQQRRKEEIEQLAGLLDLVRQRREEEIKCQEEERRRAYEEKREKYVKMYGGVPIEYLAGFPAWARIGPDGLPKMVGSEGWGDWFTYYVTKHGKCVHGKYNCCGATLPVHAWMIESTPLCSKCCKNGVPNMSWYREYLRIKAIKEKYGID